jgi:rhamnosyltransferase
MVCIVLASFNGERYIREQINSIISQSYTDWKLIIRDDGSVDNTVSIIKSLCSSDMRLEFLEDNENLGACGNFFRLTKYSVSKYDPDYVLFSDQDDFWFKEKIEILLNSIKSHEKIEGNAPVLIHSNYILANQDLEPILQEMKRDSMTWMVKHSSFFHTVFQNNIYGCTTIANRLLLKELTDDFLLFENHDQWLALTALWDGRLIYMSAQLMYYRQHHSNVTGSYLTRKPYHKKLKSLFHEIKAESYSVLRGIMYLDYFRNKVNSKSFIFENKKKGKLRISRDIIWFCLKNRIIKNSLHETIFFYICLLYSTFREFDNTEILKKFKMDNKQTYFST